jgi:hypothetical protein
MRVTNYRESAPNSSVHSNLSGPSCPKKQLSYMRVVALNAARAFDIQLPYNPTPRALMSDAKKYWDVGFFLGEMR